MSRKDGRARVTERANGALNATQLLRHRVRVVAACFFLRRRSDHDNQDVNMPIAYNKVRDARCVTRRDAHAARGGVGETNGRARAR